ncbi:hypothetical protein N7474_008591 [Penicillium riverlandense]|uniref:uncharacterized protein n=1 Tax=Penicillium riverlandense TaxID=1903569 RepID=UPI0025473052|nr:uncharacterized protein N7474_008591 [Penicillium riverlandense]KAJ5812290.1 hypothetical protein N7474_008591 [Penicillium riverlandense]
MADPLSIASGIASLLSLKLDLNVSAAGFKGRIHLARRRAAYPFRKNTLKKLEEDVGEIRQHLSFALDVLQLKSHNQIEDNISEVKSLVERTNASQISFTIRAWLMATNVSLNHNAICAKRHQSTGLWFVNGHQFTNYLVERRAAGSDRALPLYSTAQGQRVIDAYAVDLSVTPHLDRDGRSYEQDDLVDICLRLIEIGAIEDDNWQNTLTTRIDFRITQFGSKVTTQNPTQPGSGLIFTNPDPTRTQYWGPNNLSYLTPSNQLATLSTSQHTIETFDPNFLRPNIPLIAPSCLIRVRPDRRKAFVLYDKMSYND